MDNISLLSEIKKVKPRHLREKEFLNKLKFGERRNIAILFLDLHGFTPLSEFLDPEEIKGVIDEIFTIFSDLIEKYHGYIDKYEGDLIMALFGAKKSTESNVERALRASIEIISYLKKINEAIKDKKHKISLRIGIHYGLVVTGKAAKGRDKDYTVMGDAVNVAERLQSNAPLNSILVSEKVIKMGNELFKYRYLGELKLKGRKKTIKAYIVEGLNERHIERWEKKNIKAEKYIGRKKEIKRIEDYCKISRKGKVVIIGEGGIGKSRLANEIYIRNKEKLNLLKGHTLSYVSSPFYPIIDISNQIFANRGLMQKLKEVANKDGLDFESDIKRIISDMLTYKSILSDNVTTNFIRTVKNAFLKLIILYLNTNNDKKLIFQIEDFHWIDEASLLIIRYLMEEIPEHYNILFVITTRDDNYLKDWLIINSLIIKLKPLDMESRKRLFNVTLKNSRISEESINNIVNMSGGNPLYIEEIARILSSGEFSKNSLANLILPDTVEGIILARFDNLSDKEKLVLQIASCFGIKFYTNALRVIIENLNENANDLGNTLEYLVNTNFLKRKISNAFTFIHFLEKEAVYNTILNYNKRLIHNLIGKYLEEKSEHDHYIAEIMYHFINAGNRDKVVEYFSAAANYYYNRMEIKELKNLIDIGNKLIKEKEDNNFKFNILNAEISYCYKNTNYAKIADIINDNLKNYEEDKEKYSILLYKKSIVLERLGKIDDAIEILKNLIKNKRIKISRFKLYTKLSKCYYHKDLNDNAFKYLKISRKYINNNYDKSLYYSSLSMLYYSMGKLDKSIYYLKKERELKTRSEDKYSMMVIQSRMSLISLELGEYSKALKHTNEVAEMIKKYGSNIDIIMNLNTKGIIYSMVGMFENAVKIFIKGIKVAQNIRYLRGVVIMNGNMGNCYMWQENWKGAKIFLNRAIESSRSMKWEAYTEDLLSDLFLCNIMLGDKEECKRQINELTFVESKQKVYKLIYEKKIMKNDITEQLYEMLGRMKDIDWTLSNNENILSLFYFLLSDNIKRNEYIKSFLIDKSITLIKSRKNELIEFPLYKEGFFIRNINGIIKFLKEE